MTQERIMYVCNQCADNYPEGCGHFDRNDLRVMPNGDWLCEVCFDDTDQEARGNKDENEFKTWSDLPPAPEYSPISSTHHASPGDET